MNGHVQKELNAGDEPRTVHFAEPAAVAEGQCGTAVAEDQGANAVEEDQGATADEAGIHQNDAEHGSESSSVVGDTIVDSSGGEQSEDPAAVAARRETRLCPKAIVHGNVPAHGRPSPPRNSDNEVGNFGLYFGNWGTRGSFLSSDKEKGQRRDVQDRQILKSPAQIIILCEANEKVLELLEQSPEPGNEGDRDP